MLLPLLLSLQQISSPPRGCPDLSGDYVIQGEDGRVYVSIVQTRCSRIRIGWNYGAFRSGRDSTHFLSLDGEFHRDTGWFGSRQPQRTSARLFANRLEIISQPTRPDNATGFIGKHILQVLSNGDLCTRLLNPNGSSQSAMLASRVKASGSRGEAEAARRSEEGCS